MWVFKTGVGIFQIRFIARGRGFFVLAVDDRELGTYPSPDAAADDVYLRNTGFEPWDSAGDAPRPLGIDEWVRMDCAAWDSHKLSSKPAAGEEAPRPRTAPPGTESGK